MGYVTTKRRPWLVMDAETAPVAHIDEWADHVRIDSRLKDPDKIAEAKRAALDKAAVDIDLARVVCTGLWSSNEDAPVIYVGGTEEDEIFQLGVFWSMYRDTVEAGGLVIGFNTIGFDLPLYVRRSQLLGVRYDIPNLYKFKSAPILDIENELCFYGAKPMRSLAFRCVQFGIDIPDATSGADMPALIAAGDWDAVRAHNLADLRRTQALAQRLGYIGAPAQERAA